MAATKEKRKVSMVVLVKKIAIDKNNYVKVFADGSFEVNCKVGPLEPMSIT